MKHVAVVGAGTMGAGIAQLAAQNDCTVTLIDVSPDVLERAMAEITRRLDRSVEKGRISADQRDAILDRLSTSDVIADLPDVELAIEAVIEDLDIKAKVFRALEEATPETAILATNTSSLSVEKIAASISDPSRVIGTHFFNPAPVMPLVEVIAHPTSRGPFITSAIDTLTDWGKVPVRAKDTPGFIVNRVARGFYLEGLRLLGEGVAGVDEIDGVMRTHGQFRMGPFELMDLVGLDVNYTVSCSVWEQMDRSPRFKPHEIQEKLVQEGHIGRKSGRGFYDYSGETPLPAQPVDRKSFELTPTLSDVLLAFAARAGAPAAGSTEQYIFARILIAVINEAGFAFTEDVAGADDIDIAMQKGTNYPKGPLAWADEIGHFTVAGMLRALNETVEDGRYEPAPLFGQARS